MNGSLINVILVVAAAGLLREAYRYAVRVRRGAASRSWPSVEGQVERSETFRQSLRGDRRRGYVYVPLIHFAYRVAGREHRGDEIAFGHESLYTSAPDRAQRKCNQYPLGMKVRVYYDPQQPDVACLERGTGSQALGYLACVAFTAVALVLMGIVVT